MSFEPQKCVHGTVVQEVVDGEPVIHSCPSCLAELSAVGMPGIGASLDDVEAFMKHSTEQ